MGPRWDQRENNAVLHAQAAVMSLGNGRTGESEEGPNSGPRTSRHHPSECASAAKSSPTPRQSDERLDYEQHALCWPGASVSFVGRGFSAE